MVNGGKRKRVRALAKDVIVRREREAEEKAFQEGLRAERLKQARERGRRRARRPSTVRQAARGFQRVGRVGAATPRVGLQLFRGATRQLPSQRPRIPKRSLTETPSLFPTGTIKNGERKKKTIRLI